MIPLRTSVAQHRTPWVNHTLIGLNLAFFAYELALGPQVENLFHFAPGMLVER